MKQNKLTITINKPLAEVFEFTTNPNKTNLWVKTIAKEETNEYPVKLGTIYKNHNGNEIWDEYTVSDFEQDKIFELTSADKKYQVRYTYKDLGNNSTEMEYFEWMNEGELSNPFQQSVLEDLKKILES